jgi:hypothetical protein
LNEDKLPSEGVTEEQISPSEEPALTPPALISVSKLEVEATEV